MFGRIKLKLQCSKNRDRIPMCAKMREIVECLYSVGKNINVWKEKVRNRIFGSKGREFNVSTDKG